MRGTIRASILVLLVWGLAGFLSAQTRGLVVNGTGEVHVVDYDSGAVLTTIDLGGPRGRVMLDCEVSSDGHFAYVADTINFGIWVIDLTGMPALAAGTSFIALSDPPQDMTITPDGRFLVAASNSNQFFRLSVVDLETRRRVAGSPVGGMQSVDACDDGFSLITTSAASGMRRFTIDGNGQLSFTGDSFFAQFFVDSLCAPGSQTVVINNFDTTIFGSAQIRSLALPDLRTLDVLPTGRENAVTVLLSDTGAEMYARMRSDVRGYRYDPVTGAIDDAPFFRTGGLSFVNTWAGGERMRLHPDGTRLYATSAGRIDVFDSGDGRLLGSIEGAPGGAICAAPELVPGVVTAATGGPYTVPEGGVAVLSAAGSTSPDGGIVLVEWDFDFDGAVFAPDAVGETVTLDTSTIAAPSTLVIAVRVTDAAGNQTLETTTIDIVGVTLEADAGGPYFVVEGGTVVLSAEGTTSSSPDLLSFAWDLDGDGSFDDASGATTVFDASGLDGPTSVLVSVRVNDSSTSDVATATVDVSNASPSVVPLADQQAVEGEIVSIPSLAFGDPGGTDALSLTLTLDWGDGSAPLLVSPATSPVSANHVYADDGSYVVAAEVADDDGGVGATQFLATVVNAPPLLGVLDLPADPTPVGQIVAVSAAFADAGTLDTHTATLDWGDGVVQAAMVEEAPFGPPGDVAGMSGSLSGEHTFMMPGLYALEAVLTDDEGGMDRAVSSPIVVFDPEERDFVTGGGHFTSPPGAYRSDPSSSGKASFGFVVKYNSGQLVPSGKTEFQFRAAPLNFHAEVYDWLIVSEATAVFRGAGRVNQTEGYTFLVTVVDGTPQSVEDEFRIQIWSSSSGELVYDNAVAPAGEPPPSTPIDEGAILIHTRGKS